MERYHVAKSASASFDIFSAETILHTDMPVCHNFGHSDLHHIASCRFMNHEYEHQEVYHPSAIPGSVEPKYHPSTAVQEHCSNKCDRGVLRGLLAECANPLTWRGDSRWVRATMQSRSACLEEDCRRIKDRWWTTAVSFADHSFKGTERPDCHCTASHRLGFFASTTFLGVFCTIFTFHGRGFARSWK